MPAAYVAKVARETGRSVAELEAHWKAAEEKVRKQYGTTDGHFGVVTTIFKNMAHHHESVEESGEDSEAREEVGTHMKQAGHYSHLLNALHHHASPGQREHIAKAMKASPGHPENYEAHEGAHAIVVKHGVRRVAHALHWHLTGPDSQRHHDTAEHLGHVAESVDERPVADEATHHAHKAGQAAALAAHHSAMSRNPALSGQDREYHQAEATRHNATRTRHAMRFAELGHGAVEKHPSYEAGKMAAHESVSTMPTPLAMAEPVANVHDGDAHPSATDTPRPEDAQPVDAEGLRKRRNAEWRRSVLGKNESVEAPAGIDPMEHHAHEAGRNIAHLRAHQMVADKLAARGKAGTRKHSAAMKLVAQHRNTAHEHNAAFVQHWRKANSGKEFMGHEHRTHPAYMRGMDKGEQETNHMYGHNESVDEAAGGLARLKAAAKHVDAEGPKHAGFEKNDDYHGAWTVGHYRHYATVKATEDATHPFRVEHQHNGTHKVHAHTDAAAAFKHAKELHAANESVQERAKLGSGKRFAAIKAKAAKEPSVRDPAAVAAAAGIKAHGKNRMERLARAGKRKANEDMMSGGISTGVVDDTHMVVAGAPGMAAADLKLKPNDVQHYKAWTGMKAAKDTRYKKPVYTGKLHGADGDHHVFDMGKGAFHAYPVASVKGLKKESTDVTAKPTNESDMDATQTLDLALTAARSAANGSPEVRPQDVVATPVDTGYRKPQLVAPGDAAGIAAAIHAAGIPCVPEGGTAPEGCEHACRVTKGADGLVHWTWVDLDNDADRDAPRNRTEGEVRVAACLGGLRLRTFETRPGSGDWVVSAEPLQDYRSMDLGGLDRHKDDEVEDRSNQRPDGAAALGEPVGSVLPPLVRPSESVELTPAQRLARRLVDHLRRPGA